MDRSKNEALTTDTLTWIASQTKLTTSVAVLQVVEKGLVGLDDDVREILPQLKELKVITGFEADDADGEALAKGAGGEDAGAKKSTGSPILEDVKSKITLR